jgi:hypothetical protein
MTTTDKPAPTPRLVSREVQKAETRLLNLQKLKAESLVHHAASWDAKRAIYIENLPADVRRMLVAGGVLSAAEVDDAVAE